MKNIISIGDEIWMNGDEYTGYVQAISDSFIEIENYDLQIEKVPVSEITKIKNRDTGNRWTKE